MATVMVLFLAAVVVVFVFVLLFVGCCSGHFCFIFHWLLLLLLLFCYSFAAAVFVVVGCFGCHCGWLLLLSFTIVKCDFCHHAVLEDTFFIRYFSMIMWTTIIALMPAATMCCSSCTKYWVYHGIPGTWYWWYMGYLVLYCSIHSSTWYT